MTSAAAILEDIWYRPNDPRRYLLAPLALGFGAAVAARGWAYRNQVLRSARLPVPVIVVGNLTVGGVGKTTLVAWLGAWLWREGYRPGIVLRGYRGQASSWPQQVRPDSDPRMVGDEAVLLARRTDLPVAAGPDRHAAGEALVRHQGCDIVVSDDGLQHYALARDIEILVVDGRRRFGNGWPLPAGPLREPLARARRVDLTVCSGDAGRGEFAMRRVNPCLVSLSDEGRMVPVAEFNVRDVHAVAGLGNNARFFADLKHLGFRPEPHPFPDHHEYIGTDLMFGDGRPIIMTEKDAVKCRYLRPPNAWYLRVDVELSEVFERRLETLLTRIRERG